MSFFSDSANDLFYGAAKPASFVGRFWSTVLLADQILCSEHAKIREGGGEECLWGRGRRERGFGEAATCQIKFLESIFLSWKKGRQAAKSLPFERRGEQIGQQV